MNRAETPAVAPRERHRPGEATLVGPIGGPVHSAETLTSARCVKFARRIPCDRPAFAARRSWVIEPPRMAPGRYARGYGWALRSGRGATGQLPLCVPASCDPGFADGMFTGDPMTSYSVARSAQRAIVVATWPGSWSDHSVNVTTLNDSGLAAHLASVLTHLSEDAWDAAAFLDASPALEAAVSELVRQLRTPAGRIEAVRLRADGFRHVGQWSFADATELLAEDAPSVFSKLHHTQRLTVADEIAADASERADAIRVLSSGSDPGSERSRAWQMCEVTRSLSNGQTGPLPEGAAGWLVRSWGPDLGPAERWAARDRLVRIEQLVAACEARGGRAAVQEDPLLAHLVVPHADPQADDE